MNPRYPLKPTWFCNYEVLIAFEGDQEFGLLGIWEEPSFSFVRNRFLS